MEAKPNRKTQMIIKTNAGLELLFVQGSVQEHESLIPEILAMVNEAYQATEGDLWVGPVVRTSTEELTHLLTKQELYLAFRLQQQQQQQHNLSSPATTLSSKNNLVASFHIQLGNREQQSDDAAAQLQLNMLTVKPEFRNQGVGRALFDQAEQMGRDAGLRTSLLGLLVPADPSTNQFKQVLKRWYESLGYRAVKQGLMADFHPHLANQIRSSVSLIHYEKNL